MAGADLLVSLGGWFAEPVITSVVEKAHKYLGTNYELQKDAQGMVETLIRTLVLCRATVEKAERRTMNDRNLRSWMKMLKDAVYDAEDVLDDMEAKSMQEQENIQGKSQKRFKVSQFASSSLNVFIPDDNHKRLKMVLDKLKEISDEIPKFVHLVRMNEKDEPCNYSINGRERETISRPFDKVWLLGIQKQQFDLILEMILDPESGSSKKNKHNGIVVIPIVGMGGVGKTTLAQAVYNHPQVQQTFQKKAWISVSYNLDAVGLMRNLIQTLGGYIRRDVITLEGISRNITSAIGRRRFLVVLDNMFEKFDYEWDVIYTTLSLGAPGSVVLITTQNQAFANRIATFVPVALEPLESEIFWELFQTFAFGDIMISLEKRYSLELIGKQIASKLNGLPLAAKIIGKLLRRRIDEDEWRRISRSEWWDIPEGRTQILPSIGVSYQHLDSCLRQCFAYCSLFPRNSLIDKDRLVQIWIALNFIPSDANNAREMEEIGREWFDKLVEMSFFQPAGDYIGYVMSSLMHDLAVIVSSDECFYLTDQSRQIPRDVRHLAVDTKNLDMLKGIPKQNHIRSFFYFGFSHVKEMPSSINETLSNLDSLRVLDLSYLYMETKEPPTAIQNLSHLRFLDLSHPEIDLFTPFNFDHRRFDHYHLQTLHWVVNPSNYGPWLKLPRGINRLINLRHLVVNRKTIAQISGIGHLVNLQELEEYRVGETEGHKITELQNLRELRGHLTITNCDKIKSRGEAEQARLHDKKKLHSVEFCFSYAPRESNIDEEVLEGLKPNDGISQLKIRCYMGSSFPNWMRENGHFLNLQTIHMRRCSKIEVLPPLGQLPSLKCLDLDQLNSIKVIDRCLYGNNQTVFPALTDFSFSDFIYCEEWTEQQVTRFFPQLSTLQIIRNWALKKAPLHCFSASLKSLIMERCPNFNSLAESLQYLTSLSLLHIGNCRESISLNTNTLRLLEDLKLCDCSELSIEGDLQSLTNLKRLEITSCSKLLSNSMHDITSKQKGKSLQVHQAHGLRSLSYLLMDRSLLHTGYHLILGRLPSLRYLHFKGPEPRKFTVDQTYWFRELTSLQELTFSKCEFNQLPSSLAELSKLCKVILKSCTNLESLPANGLPSSLLVLELERCSRNLVQRCRRDDGEDWQHISHVPFVKIDGRYNNN